MTPINFIPGYAWLVTLLLLSACKTPKDILYLQDVLPYQQQLIEESYEVYIQRDDLLSIVVSSKDPELVQPFNMPVISYQIGGENIGQQRTLGYQVDSKGNIDFPLLGKIQVEGLTRLELIELLKTKLIEEDYIKDPIVTVQFMNFKISVLGEVTRPGTFNITGDRITLLEALGMAGDLTIYGKRDQVIVVREKNDMRSVYYNDLRSSSLFLSPCYYLEQNDIVYVAPNNIRAGQSRINQNNTVGVWVSVLSLITTIAVLILK